MKKNKKLIIILIVVLIVIILILIAHFVNKKADVSSNDYKWEINKTGVLPSGYSQLELDNESKNHCVDDVCIKNIEMVFDKDSGVAKYELVNKSKKTIKDTYYYIVLSNDKKLLVYIKRLKKGKSYNGAAYFKDIDMYNVNDYKFVKLTEKELKNVK